MHGSHSQIKDSDSSHIVNEGEMFKSSDSLTPLTRQHQHALALAVIIHSKFGVEEGKSKWQEEMNAKVQQIFKAELARHFEVEETILYPAIERHLGPLELLRQLRREHWGLRGLVERLAFLPDGDLLDEFATLLEMHVDEEERELFPVFAKKIPRDEAIKLGNEIQTRLVKPLRVEMVGQGRGSWGDRIPILDR
jgi:hemerythrin-like domain-containing protein